MKTRFAWSPKIVPLLLLCLFWITACGGSDTEEPEIIVRINRATFDLGTHSLDGVTSTERGITVIYESGLGNDYTGWTLSGVLQKVGEENNGVAYSRGGYGASQLGPEPRTLVQLSDELLQLKTIVSPNNKVVLVGHSWGGAIIRTFAIRFPDLVHGLVFVDPSHENQLILTQQQEDNVVQSYSSLIGASKEAEMLREGVEYLGNLPNLPNIPITVLTSLQGGNASQWSNFHRSLGVGVSSANFTHITTSDAGHNIHTETPDLVIQAINELMDKIN